MDCFFLMQGQMLEKKKNNLRVMKVTTKRQKTSILKNKIKFGNLFSTLDQPDIISEDISFLFLKLFLFLYLFISLLFYLFIHFYLFSISKINLEQIVLKTEKSKIKREVDKRLLQEGAYQKEP